MSPEERRQAVDALHSMALALQTMCDLLDIGTGAKQLRPGEMMLGPRGHVIDKLEMTYHSTHRQDRHRKPPLPDFGGAS